MNKKKFVIKEQRIETHTKIKKIVNIDIKHLFFGLGNNH